ncbi:MAG: putative sugar porter family MFS transporter [Streblomastix strix]|uniref:Putative sugar porter family MFS transporter n=1 Tax=Streblomastix strix TaxID=222440 RepID=A0A5J4VPW8_9EUKA|nr:MAG: putative sugar porter family MFS transporter [Streblomastix strix]
MGGGAYGVASSIISGILGEPKFHDEPASKKALISSSLVFGITIGALLTVLLTEYLGRRWIVIIAGIQSFIFQSILSMISHPTTIIVIRFISGIGLGSICTLTPIYCLELAQDKYKGRFVFLYQVSTTLGHNLGYLLNIIFNYVQSGWRYEFAISGIPVLIMGIGAIFCSESQARELIVGSSLAIFCQFTGINVVVYYTPQILEKAKMSKRISFLSVTLAIGVWNTLLTLPPLELIERYGRRTVLLIGSFVTTIGMLLIAIGYLVPKLVERDISYVLAIPGLIIFITGFEFGIGGVFYVLIAEMFPSKVAGVVSSLNMLIVWICADIIIALYQPLAKKISEGKVFIALTVV